MWAKALQWKAFGFVARRQSAYSTAMTLPTEDALARRDLGLRIERLLDKQISAPARELTNFQTDRILSALRQLQDGHFADGEWAMLHAERSDLFEPNDYVPRGRLAPVGELVARLKSVLEGWRDREAQGNVIAES